MVEALLRVSKSTWYICYRVAPGLCYREICTIKGHGRNASEKEIGTSTTVDKFDLKGQVKKGSASVGWVRFYDNNNNSVMMQVIRVNIGVIRFRMRLDKGNV